MAGAAAGCRRPAGVAVGQDSVLRQKIRQARARRAAASAQPAAGPYLCMRWPRGSYSEGKNVERTGWGWGWRGSGWWRGHITLAGVGGRGSALAQKDQQQREARGWYTTLVTRAQRSHALSLSGEARASRRGSARRGRGGKGRQYRGRRRRRGASGASGTRSRLR